MSATSFGGFVRCLPALPLGGLVRRFFGAEADWGGEIALFPNFLSTWYLYFVVAPESHIGDGLDVCNKVDRAESWRDPIGLLI